MDVARYGDWAKQAFVTEKVKENYGRRFQITYPDEELMAGRPLNVQPVHEAFKEAGAVFTQVFGLECPTWFAGSPEKAHERPSFRHSDAHPLHRSRGPCLPRGGKGSRSWLSTASTSGAGLRRLRPSPRLLAGRLPEERARLALPDALSQGPPHRGFHLGPPWRRGVLHGRLAGGTGLSPPLVPRAHAPRRGWTTPPLSDETSGVMISGPRARDILSPLTPHDISNEAFPFFSCAHTEVAGLPARLLRLSFTGELGYEIYVAEADMPALLAAPARSGGGLWCPPCRGAGQS